MKRDNLYLYKTLCWLCCLLCVFRVFLYHELSDRVLSAHSVSSIPCHLLFLLFYRPKGAKLWSRQKKNCSMKISSFHSVRSFHATNNSSISRSRIKYILLIQLWDLRSLQQIGIKKITSGNLWNPKDSLKRVIFKCNRKK